MAAKKDSTFHIDTNVLLIGGGVVLLYFGVLKPVLQTLGIMNDANDNLVNDTVNDGTANPFDPNFYKAGPVGTKLLHNEDADNYAKVIYYSFGPLWDDEERVLAIFRALQTQSQVSYLAERFMLMYRDDLLSFLKGGMWPQDRLSNAELADIIKLVKQKPPYK